MHSSPAPSSPSKAALTVAVNREATEGSERLQRVSGDDLPSSRHHMAVVVLTDCRAESLAKLYMERHNRLA
jgi:hypothetical protein